jgi:hypothetical protein
MRFLQISNSTDFADGIFSLANRPTYSLWRFEVDGDNIIIWMPELDRAGANLRSLRDQDDKALLVDSTSNNEVAIREWARSHYKANERPRRMMPLALTRKGTEFVVPASAQPHMAADYERLERGGETPPARNNE